MKLISSLRCRCLIVLLVACGVSAAEAGNGPDYLAHVKAYADTMLEKGRDERMYDAANAASTGPRRTAGEPDPSAVKLKNR